ncbi:4-(cytidine 5'-diphospho)-2-C-methyl-D-erythritol kinase [Sphingomonas hylomeconis]|uniref:4-diphosphocytidyl-2-C-methyl-D-erythritol kinase n=1 Tax=Sphingomonas hylomeconis TaxID=1395958 RepID=A0ABV7SXG3_9SPHN|nr:4-(cytidine 5'-diphospho)-2-C-methyl-D-erythritol kinase [Sphingomonas hylomeconis]
MIREPAPAKINLALHVRRRRADGYHELETLFAFLRHGDEIRLQPGPASFTIDGPFAAGLDPSADNLVTSAASIFAQRFAIEQDYAITLTKNLPIASGIGGGSADAAATLRALARLHDIPLEDATLFACADTLGSDVPACLYGRNALGTGRGEQLEPLDGLTDIPVLLVNPNVALSTATVFQRWDGIDRGAIPDGAMLDRARAGRNDLEPPARFLAPAIGAVLDRLEAGDPLLARMSGSGATCFALYDSVDARSAAAAQIRAAQPDWWCLESTLA